MAVCRETGEDRAESPSLHPGLRGCWRPAASRGRGIARDGKGAELEWGGCGTLPGGQEVRLCGFVPPSYARDPECGVALQAAGAGEMAVPPPPPQHPAWGGIPLPKKRQSMQSPSNPGTCLLCCTPACSGTDGHLHPSWETPSAFPLPSPSPCPPHCSSQGVCNAGGFATLLLETRWKHLRKLVPGEERCLHRCSPSLGWPRRGAPWCKEESEPNVLHALGCDLIQENVSIWDFQRVRGTVCALGYRSRSTWSVAFWQTHLGFVERRALAAHGAGRGGMLPLLAPGAALDAASCSLSRRAGTGSTRHCVGSGCRA